MLCWLWLQHPEATFALFALEQLAVLLLGGGAQLCTEGAIHRQVQCVGVFDSALVASSSPLENKLWDKWMRTVQQ